MGVYKYQCPHDDCEKMAEGIRKCKACDKIIITDRGVEPKVTIDWEE